MSDANATNAGPSTGNQPGTANDASVNAGAAAGAAAVTVGTQTPPVIGAPKAAVVDLKDTWSGVTKQELRELVHNKGWNEKGLDDILDSYRQLEAKSGRSIPLPGENATPEEVAEFRLKLGVPVDANGYEFKAPDGMLSYSTDLADGLKAWGHELGIPKAQLEQLHDKYVGYMQGLEQGIVESDAQLVARADVALKKAWGETPEAYKTEIAKVNAWIRHNGGSELENELKAFGVINADGHPKSAAMLIAIAKLAGHVYSEDVAIDSFGGEISKNPFTKQDQDLTARTELLKYAKTGPGAAAKVSALIIAAGKDPKVFGI